MVDQTTFKFTERKAYTIFSYCFKGVFMVPLSSTIPYALRMNSLINISGGTGLKK